MDAYKITMGLSSGFVVEVTPMPPYYADFINDLYPLKDLPKRKVTLLAGDTVDYPYEPPSTVPDVTDADFALYAVYKEVEAFNAKQEALKARAKRDYLLATCVTVQSGPVSVDDTSWVERLEAGIDNFVVPTHRGKRLLFFLKAVVIVTPADMDAVISAALFPEVTMQGVVNALRSFPDEVER